MTRARVLLADDHTLVAEGIGTLLKDRYKIVGIVNDGHSLVQAALKLRPDVIVADISMPRKSGLEALRELKALGLPAKFLVLTMDADPLMAVEALEAGAAGYLLKHSTATDLFMAMQEVLKGRIYTSPSAQIPRLSNKVELLRTRPIELSPRRREVLRLIAQGQRPKQIASELGLSKRTVETHKYEIMSTLGLRSTAELVRYAVKLRLVPE
ncbi:MAG TPA: response regulator transcription factor [Vicinamibacterales bacterium]|jgi:DNA-binding NarL/FixJ family response regulator